MDPVVAAYGQLLAIQTMLVNRALAALSEEEIWRRPAAEANSVGWLLGHITTARNGMVTVLGGDPERAAWLTSFGRGAQVAERDAYPPTSDVVETLKRINAKLKARMEAATEEELGAPSPLKTPSPDPSVRGTVGFLIFHDGYHVGQIAYVMKLLGKPGLVG
jgi:uncharacterized damage-inducible protein DinB